MVVLCSHCKMKVDTFLECSLKSFHLDTMWVLAIEDLPVMTTAGGWVDRRQFNSLAPWKYEWNFIYVIFKWILVIDGWGISCQVALIWMSLDFTDNQSTLVHVMAWCHQATSHYLSQCWTRSLAPYGVIRPQWVNSAVTGPWMKIVAYLKFHISLFSSSWQ